MKKIRILIVPVAMVIIGMFLMYIGWDIFTSIANDLDKEATSTKEQYVGKKLFIDGDSLTIVDMSVLLKRCTLSNGTKISQSFADKQLKSKE